MKFALDDEQHAFARSLDDLLGASNIPAVVRAWGTGDASAGRKLWTRLAELGLHALRVPEDAGGLGAAPIDMVVAFERLGYHLVPGPYVESVVVAPVLLRAAEPDTLAELATGERIVTLAAPPVAPLALDADVAHQVLLVDGGELHVAEPGPLRRSVDATRRLFPVNAQDSLATLPAATERAALDAAALGCAAQLLGAGERLLAETVEYAKTRRQFGRAIGEFQALKHAMADVRVALDFARPLLHGAALSAETTEASRDISAAKVATAEAAYLASRTALQVHGAIGYTLEHDLGLWITKVRALVSAWGTTAAHRAHILAAISSR